MTLVPYFSRGAAYAQKSFEIRKALGDMWGQGQSLAYHGIVPYAGSKLANALKDEGVRLLERMGDLLGSAHCPTTKWPRLCID